MSSTSKRNMAHDIAGGGDTSPGNDSRPEPIVHRSHPEIGNSSLVLRSLFDVQPRQIDYLWKSWLARGKLHLLGGLPGDGKSTIAANIAAVGSIGGQWPDGTQASHFRTLFLLGEDDLEDTLRPRLDLHGADATQIEAVEMVLDHKGCERFFNVAHHLPLLESAVEQYNFDLIIIDPLTTIMAGSDGNAEGDVRDRLTPLTRLAQKHSVAVLGIVHVGKSNGVDRDAAQRLLGSTAFVAMSRVVWQTASAGEDMMALGVTKSNLSMKPPALLWTRREDGPITWHGASDKSINDLMRGGGAPRPGQAAEEFLLEFLAVGPRQASEVEEAALALGIAKRTLDRARDVVGVKAFKERTAHGKWLCHLPGHDPASEVKTDGDTDATKAANSNVVDLVSVTSYRAEEAS